MENKTFTAKDAVAIAQTQGLQNLDWILSRIRNDAEIGRFYRAFKGAVSKTIQNELEALGYDVAVLNEETIVSWNPAVLAETYAKTATHRP